LHEQSALRQRQATEVTLIIFLIRVALPRATRSAIVRCGTATA
jgi:hypothetical protein